MAPITQLVRRRFLRFRREILVVLLAVRHPDTPLHLRLAGAGLILYLLSPIDLIPLAVPVLGLVDDLLLVPWGVSRVVARLPRTTREESEARARRIIDRWVTRPLLALSVVLLGLFMMWGLILWLVWRWVSG
ncbi:MAG: DUF1232 domain-containing protein [Gemmatimonadales bacterium]|nr:MAG: DUF1232 domain-containing protein [Gemmatimonadales bacterium]